MKIDSEYEYEFEIAFCALSIGPYPEWYAMKVTEPYFRSSSSAKYKYGKNKEVRSIVSKKELLVPITVSKFNYRRRLPVAVLGSHMYCLGPVEPSTFSKSNQVWTLDLTSTSSSNCWKPGPHTNFTRSNPHVVVLDNKLYALGSFHPDFEAESSGCGWMEVFDPKLGSWESLPNPPSRCFLQRIMLSAPLHDKKQIVVAERCNGGVTFHVYNVETRRWATLDPPRRDDMSAQFKGRDGYLNEDTITALGPAVVGHTLYWGFLDDQKLCLQAYNLDTDVWFYARLDLRSSVLWKGECLPSQLSTSLLHLTDHKFCFLFWSVGRGRFLNCLIFDVSPISRKNYHYHDNDEDDDFSRNLYCDRWKKPFSRLGISIVSIHKYPFHGCLEVYHTVLLDAGFYTSKKKKPKLSRKPIESPTYAGFYTPKMKKPKSSHKP
ncbi:f-box/kelch-repeat protein [Quercus suber]|uniref:F-box/kelch-repeat protein n=2 Tax=Quercus suber TaxID=58331 RepID=A0AAW0IQ02_QUESU